MHLREADVEHRSIEGLCPGRIESAGPVFASNHIEADPFEAQDEESTRNGFVLNNQNLAVIRVGIRHVLPSVESDVALAKSAQGLLPP